MHPGILKHPCFIPTFLVFIILSACTGSDRSVSQIPIPQYPQLNLTSTEDLSGFPTAIHITELTTQDAYLSLFTTEKTASLVVLENTDNQWEKHTEQNISISDSGFSYYDLKDLKPNTAYASYALSIDHTRRTSITFFRTPIDSGTTRLIRFGATSCFGSNNRPWAPLNHAAAQNLDFFLLLGDTVYADQSQNLQGYRDFWSYTQSVPGFRNLASSTSLYATWDDHEIVNNWPLNNAATPERLEWASQAFFEALPWRKKRSGISLWRSYTWGDQVEMFILDSRSERSNNDYISKEQMDWLKVELSNSAANFKLILSSVPVTDMGDLVGEFYAKDRWQGYPTQRQEILEHIDNNKISGIYWLAGDLHFGMMSHLSPEGEPGANNWEIIVGPVGSPVLPLVSSNLIEPGDQYPHLIAKWNYVLFEADPITHNLEVQYIGNEGNVLFRKTLLSKGNQTDTEQ